jgi:hypothetical protein
MIKVRITEIDATEKISQEEIRSAIKNCNPERLQPSPAGPKRSGGAFAHIGAIGPQGRETYQKFSALFGSRPYPGANCGISILGAGSLANLRKLIQNS